MNNPIMQMFNQQIQSPQNNSLAALIALIKSGGNPQVLINSMAAQNPKIGEAMQLLQGKSPQDMENICRDLCKQRGIDFNNVMQQVQSLMR